jgi:hypothetical protein
MSLVLILGLTGACLALTTAIFVGIYFYRRTEQKTTPQQAIDAANNDSPISEQKNYPNTKLNPQDLSFFSEKQNLDISQISCKRCDPQRIPTTFLYQKI